MITITVKPDKSAPIGVYDSGVGGLTVWRRLRERLPMERVCYYADTAHVPYGGRRPEEILQFSREIIRFMELKGAKLVIAACATSSALALPRLAPVVSVPVIGMIKPAIEAAISISKNGRIGMLATEGTVRSRAHADLLARLRPDYEIVSQACPRLVPLIEAGHTSGPELENAVAEYVEPLLKASVDCIILGCTHYPLIAPVIQAAAGDVVLLDPADAVAECASEELTRRQLMNDTGAGSDLVYASGDPAKFSRAAQVFGFAFAGGVEQAGAQV